MYMLIMDKIKTKRYTNASFAIATLIMSIRVDVTGGISDTVARAVAVIVKVLLVASEPHQVMNVDTYLIHTQDVNGLSGIFPLDFPLH